jgi:hypothetical protein
MPSEPRENPFAAPTTSSTAEPDGAAQIQKNFTLQADGVQGTPRSANDVIDLKGRWAQILSQQAILA